MIREDVNNFGLGRPPICVEYHRRMASAVTSSLEDPSARHRAVSLSLLNNQIAHPKNLSVDFLNNGVKTNLHIKRQLSHCMRARQLFSIHLSELHLREEWESMIHDDLKNITKALSLHRPSPRNVSNLIMYYTTTHGTWY
eukprot:941401-Pelagomonas_calceolata.AAC.1